MDQLSRACSLNPWTFMKFASRRWKDFLELFPMVYHKCIYENIWTPKFDPENGGPSTEFWKCQKLSVGWFQSWSLDQLSRACSFNPWTFMSCIGMRWKDLFKLFTKVYIKVIYEVINTFKIEPENGVPTLNSWD